MHVPYITSGQWPPPPPQALAALDGAVGRARWLDAIAKHDNGHLRQKLVELAASADCQPLLDTIFGHSPFLTDLLILQPETVLHFAQKGPDASYASLMAQTAAKIANEDDVAKLMRKMRLAKQQLALTVALADIGGHWSLTEVTEALSAFAALCVDACVRHGLRRLQRLQHLRLNTDDITEGCGLVVLGMGKLGAGELNYSSDIDLVVFYDEAVVPIGNSDSISSHYTRLVRDMVRHLSERTDAGYVFRTDLRLRPDPAATPLAISFAAAENYYSSIGENWERAAFIKARAIAGDSAAAARLQYLLRPFIWRQKLDFSLNDEFVNLRARMIAQLPQPNADILGHNAKLGHGGIRSIEFIAQSQQLIFAGRQPLLREPATLKALALLQKAQRLEAEIVQHLHDAYLFLRRVEHRLQMRLDEQTHSLAPDETGIAQLAYFLGYTDTRSFMRDYRHHTQLVEQYFTDILGHSAASAPFWPHSSAAQTALLQQHGFMQAEASAQLIQKWLDGQTRATRHKQTRQQLQKLLPALLQYFATSSAPDDALTRFDEFLAALPVGGSFFALLDYRPRLLGVLAQIMSSAPALAAQLAQQPQQLEALALPLLPERFPAKEELRPFLQGDCARAESYEDKLNALRRFNADQKLRAGLDFLRGQSGSDQLPIFLADLAELILQELLIVQMAEFAKHYGTITDATLAIVAMGRLGERQMTLSSDLDLLVIYAAPNNALSSGTRALSAPEYFAKFTAALSNALTAPTSFGLLYPLDLRLRPSGHAGPLATSLEAFTQYQLNSAWTWEQMALCKARFVAGDEQLGTKISLIKQNTLARPRDALRLRQDVLEMRALIDKAHKADTIFEVKYSRGGLVDLDFIAEYLLLKHCAAMPDMLHTDGTDIFAAAANNSIISPTEAKQAQTALLLQRRILGFQRFSQQQQPHNDAQAAAMADYVLRGQGLDAVILPDALDFTTLRAILAQCQAQVTALWQKIFSN